MALTIADHPLLDAGVFVTRFDQPLAALPHVAFDIPAPIATDGAVKTAVRDLLRAGGFKPAGRSKPASEYLSNVAALPRINAAVDACNLVSLHSGLPISVVDLERARAPFRIGVASESSAYVFNASGQEIDLGGLLCLFDADGACANAVRDAQRTKTRDETTATLSIVWGCVGFETRLRQAEQWYRSLLESAGATTRAVDAMPSEARS